MSSKLEVSIINKSDNPIDAIYTAYRMCYSPKAIDAEKIPLEEKVEFIQRMLETGHESPEEHVSISFKVYGVSKALTHQLVRKRIASYSQQSGRYVDAKNMQYITPPNIERMPEAYKKFIDTMNMCWQAYEEINSMLKERGYSETKEDARFVIPQAMSTGIVITLNLRSLKNLFKERLCKRAQWEIRNLVKEMMKASHEYLPELIPNVSMWCDVEGVCKENGKFCCGRHPNLEELKKSERF